MKLDNILCAIDFSKFDGPVLGHGVELTRRFNARLFVFHAVYCPHDPLYGTAEFERGGEMEKQVAHYRQEITALMQPETVCWEAMVRVGDPATVISKVAGQMNADLVIGATHGHSGWQRMFIGTVVERMARNLACPFLVIPGLNPKMPDKQHHKKPIIKTIVVGCDFSRETQPATDYAAGLAKEFNSALHLFHAVESPIDETVADQTQAPYGQIQQTLQKRLHQSLTRLVPKTNAGVQRLKIALAPGLPAEQLPSYAARQKTDILVVGVRRHHKLEKFLVGSTTEAVLRHSPCPVLVVP